MGTNPTGAGTPGAAADAAHPAGIPPGHPEGVRCGVGAAGGCGTRGNSKRPEGSPNRYRSDSSGMLYAFPIQRSSGSVRVALRLPCPESLLPVKNFHPCPQMPAAPTPHRLSPGGSGRIPAGCAASAGCPWRPGSGGVLSDGSVRKGSGTEFQKFLIKCIASFFSLLYSLRLIF